MSSIHFPDCGAAHNPAFPVSSQPYMCSLCGAGFERITHLRHHIALHTTERNYDRCPYCGRHFDNLSNLKIHLREHTGDRSYRCYRCAQTFRTVEMLRLHTKTHIIRCYVCAVCSRGFCMEGTLKVHTRGHTKEQVYPCMECGHAFRQLGALRLHLKKHTGGDVQECWRCGARYSTEEELRQHELQVHGHIHKDSSLAQGEVTMSEQDQPVVKAAKIKNTRFVCNVCGKQYGSASGFETHRLTHDRPAGEELQCSVCNLLFPTNITLVKHEKTHSAEIPYCCPDPTCAMGFFHSRAMRRHLQTTHPQIPLLKTLSNCHVEGYKPPADKVHWCEQCSKGFRVKRDLRYHMMFHTGQFSHWCQWCSKGFSTKARLQKHQNQHIGAKDFSCTVCGKRFSTSYTLSVHMRRHTGDVRNVCPHCGKPFHSPNHLRTHMVVHTGERNHHCNICNKSFTQASSLRAHIRNVHKVDPPSEVRENAASIVPSSITVRRADSMST